MGNSAHTKTEDNDHENTTGNISLFAHTQTGDCREASFEEILSTARAMFAHRVRRGTPLTSPNLVRDFLTLMLGSLEYEVSTD